MALSSAVLVAVLLVLARQAQGGASSGSLRGSGPVDEVDVAVVGGGISGTYTAFRLLSSGRYGSDQVALFERTDRIGGRYDSPTIGCGNPELMSESELKKAPRSELGGMIVRSTDRLMRALVKELGIELGPFHMNKGARMYQGSKVEGGDDEPSNPVFLRGLRSDRQSVMRLAGEERFVNAGPGNQTGPNSVLPYELAASEFLPRRRGRRLQAKDKLEPHPDACNPANAELMNRRLEPSGLRIWELSTWSRDNYMGTTNEYRELSDALGWGRSAAGPRSTRNLGVDEDYEEIRSAVGLKPDLYWERPLLGMQEFPRSLHKKYTAAKGRSFMNQQLRMVERVSGQYPYLLTFMETATSPCTGITTPTGKTWKLRAKRVILAMPKAPLEAVEFVGTVPGSKSSLAQHMNRLTRAIKGVPFMKLHASFGERWWQHVGIGKETDFNVGRFTSTSSVNNLFAWYPGTQARDEDGQYSQIPLQCKKTSGEHMGAIQIYSTGHPEDIWSGVTQRGRQQDCQVNDATRCAECFNNETGFFVTDSNPAKNHIPQVLVNTVVGELAEMFGANASQIPEPTEVQYKIWDARDPVTLSDAVHFWEAGQQWWKLYDEVLEVGSKDSRLHIVGEAFSYNYGWGEGALETAEYMLHEHLDIPLPSWVTRDQYCQAMPFYPFERK